MILMNNTMKKRIKGFSVIFGLLILLVCFFLIGVASVNKDESLKVAKEIKEEITKPPKTYEEKGNFYIREIPEEKKSLLRAKVKSNKLREELNNKKLDLHKAQYYKVIKDN